MRRLAHGRASVRHTYVTSSQNYAHFKSKLMFPVVPIIRESKYQGTECMESILERLIESISTLEQLLFIPRIVASY